jgi:hypothetical protein
MTPSPSDSLALSDRYRWSALQITLIYVAAAGFWILFGDHMLENVLGDAEIRRYTYYQNIKGAGFIVLTSTMLYLLIRRSHRNIHELEQERARIDERYWKLIDASQQGVWILDDAGRTPRLPGRCTSRPAFP